MRAMLIGVGSYFLTGILSLILPRHKFGLSLLGWMGGLYALIYQVLLIENQSYLIRTIGIWGKLGIEVKLDQTTVLFSALIITINIFTLLYMGREKKVTFYCLYNLLLGTAFSISFVNDLFNLYVTIELMSLVSILLIGYQRKAYQIYAGIKYLLLSSLSMSLYLIGLGIIYNSGGSLAISELAKTVGSEPSFSVSLASSLMIGGLAVKGGVILFSMWLPDAHSYSSNVVSALLSGMAIKCGLIGIIRISEIVTWNEGLFFLGAFTGIGGVMFAILENRTKMVLAYHTISQVGYILLGVGTGTNLGIIAASLHIFFHGVFKSLLFLSVGHAKIGGLNIYKIKKKVPLISKIGLLVGSFSIVSLPPFNSYFSKILLLEQCTNGLIRAIILTIGVGTAFSFVKLNYTILPTETRKEMDRKNIALSLYSFVVAVSGISVLLFLNKQEILHLLNNFHVIETISLLAFGILLYPFTKEICKKAELPSYPFNLDNSLFSFITGSLVMSLLLVVF